MRKRRYGRRVEGRPLLVGLVVLCFEKGIGRTVGGIDD